MSRNASLAACLAATLASAGFAQMKTNMAQGALANWDAGVIRARGLAATSRPPDARRLLMLRRMATIRAQRDLLAYIKGMAIDSNTSFLDSLESEEYSEAVKTKVEGTIKGARMVREGQIPGAPQIYEVIMEVPLDEVRRTSVVPNETGPDGPPVIIPSMNYADMGGGYEPTGRHDDHGNPVQRHPTADDIKAAANDPMGVDPSMVSPELIASDELAAALYGETAPPVQTMASAAETTLPAVTTSGSYTGVIVDATGLGADRALWPRLLDQDGSVLYGNYDLSDDFLYNEGAVQYATSLEEAKGLSRAGSNPLVVKASATQGAYKADLVLGGGAAKKLGRAGEALTKLRVILVL